MVARSAERRRSALITVVLVCLFCFALTVLYASYLDDWEGRVGLVYKVAALGSIVVGLGALLLAAVDAVIARRK